MANDRSNNFLVQFEQAEKSARLLNEETQKTIEKIKKSGIRVRITQIGDEISFDIHRRDLKQFFAIWSE